MKMVILVLTFALSLTSQAATPLKRMFFFCSGNDKSSTALQVGSDAYFNGQIQGVYVKIRGFYEDYHDEEMKEPKMVVAKQAKYTPRNPKLVGLDKFVIETKKGASLSLMIPNRTELEKQWESVSESRRDLHNDFKGYVQLTDDSGDSFTVIELNCNLNWKP